MKNINISAVIIALNEAKNIEECIESLNWVDEIIVVDGGSIDKTREIARKKGAKAVEVKKDGFSDSRNKGLYEAKGSWILYVDADERVTPLLRSEIRSVISNQSSAISYSAFAIPRKNIILGKEMKHGGWWPDYVKRLFRKEFLKGWRGELHEEPEFEGEMDHLLNPLNHLKSLSIAEMVDKTNKWSEIEARLLYKANHPEMSWWRFFRIMLLEIWYRLVILRGFLDGTEGVIYSIYQSWSRFITYTKLWELQKKVKSQKL